MCIYKVPQRNIRSQLMKELTFVFLSLFNLGLFKAYTHKSLPTATTLPRLITHAQPDGNIVSLVVHSSTNRGVYGGDRRRATDGRGEGTKMAKRKIRSA